MKNSTRMHYSMDSVVQQYRERYSGRKGKYFYYHETTPVFTMLGNIVQESKILDLGMGAGRLIPLVNRLKAHYFGLDYSIKLVSVAKQDYPVESGLVIGDAYSLPFTCDQFDYVISIGLFESVDDIEKLLKEIGRVLKINGKVVFTAYNKHSWFGRARIGSVFQHRSFDIDSLIEILRESGWDNIKTNSTFHLPNRYLWKPMRSMHKYNLRIMSTLYIQLYSLIQYFLNWIDISNQRGVELIVSATKVKSYSANRNDFPV